MLKTLFIGVAGTVSLIFIWVIVQYGWRKLFLSLLTDVDVLAGRNSCGNCNCTTGCENQRQVKS